MASTTELAPEAGTASPRVFQADKAVKVLVISPDEHAHIVLRNIFGHSRWKIWFSRSWREARDVLVRTRAPVILCERDLPDGNWRSVLDETACQPEAPALIVTAKDADDRLWAEVLNLGAYDLLMRPFDAAEVFRVVGLAWLHWKNSRDLRRPAAVYRAAG